MKTYTNNNRIGRLNGTFRERTKVTRGWKTARTLIAKCERIHYNFVKPHMALGAKTPAETSRLKIDDSENKWALLRNAKG